MIHLLVRLPLSFALPRLLHLHLLRSAREGHYHSHKDNRTTVLQAVRVSSSSGDDPCIQCPPNNSNNQSHQRGSEGRKARCMRRLTSITPIANNHNSDMIPSHLSAYNQSPKFSAHILLGFNHRPQLLHVQSTSSLLLLLVVGREWRIYQGSNKVEKIIMENGMMGYQQSTSIHPGSLMEAWIQLPRLYP